MNNTIMNTQKDIENGLTINDIIDYIVNYVHHHYSVKGWIKPLTKSEKHSYMLDDEPPTKKFEIGVDDLYNDMILNGKIDAIVAEMPIVKAAIKYHISDLMQYIATSTTDIKSPFDQCVLKIKKLSNVDDIEFVEAVNVEHKYRPPYKFILGFADEFVTNSLIFYFYKK